MHVRIVDDETRFLTAADAAAADVVLAGAAPGTTFGELRAAAHKLVLQLDPVAARKRKEAARGEAHVRRFREDSGNAGMVARELPSDEVLASWQHVEQRALDLRAAGMPGTLRELRIRAYLDLLQERDSRDQPAAPTRRPGPAGREPPAPGPADPAPTPAPTSAPIPALTSAPIPALTSSRRSRLRPRHRPPAPPTPAPVPAIPAPAPVVPVVPAGTVPGRSRSRSWSRSRRRRSDGAEPGRAGHHHRPLGHLPGPVRDTGGGRRVRVLDSDEARDLTAAAARHPRTRWCITALNPDGTAAAHGCIPGRHPPPSTGPPPGLAIKNDPGRPRPLRSRPRRGRLPPQPQPAARHPRPQCHLHRAGLSRPAAHCDLDHTHPWDDGGPTCECNLAPLCRHHHRCKQAEGWQLEQPEPGVLVWRTPSGRTYTTAPTVHPV